MDLSVLFEPARLIFTIPMLIAFAFGALALVGLFDVEALDLDLDGDADFDADIGADADFGADVGADADFDADLGADAGADAGMDADAEAGASGGGLLQAIGFGLVPFSLLVVLLCFSFGWTGLLLTSLFGESVAAVVGAGFATTGVLAVPAAVASMLVTAPAARLFAPLFRDYGKAVGARELVGKTAVLNTGSVSDSFGAATVRVKGRGRVEISARADSEDADALSYGDRVLIYDYDPERNVYFVAPEDGGAAPGAAPGSVPGSDSRP
jgi:hypothetical protein